MDINNVRNLQFLDLSGVDDNEKSRVMASLQLDNPHAKLPWFIGKNKSVLATKCQTLGKDAETHDHHKNTTTTDINSKINHTYINQSHPSPNTMRVVKSYGTITPLPIQTTNIHTPQHYPGYASSNPNQHCPNYYAPPAVAPFPHPKQIFVTHAKVINDVTHPVTLNSQYNPVQSYPVSNAVNGVTETLLNHSSTQNYEMGAPNIQNNVKVPSVVQNVTSNTTSPSSVQETAVKSQDDHSEPLQSLQKIENSPSVTENNVEDQSISKPSGKSWASLFSGAKTNDESNQVVNGVKPAFEQTATNESNNNDPICPIKNPRKVMPFVDPDCYRMGEYLNSYAVDGRAISLQPRGLINQSNYCYINSILQALIACPPVYNLLSGLSQNISSTEKRKPTPVIDGMCKFVKEFNHLPANMRVRRSDGSKNQQQKKDQGVLINTDIPFEPSWIYRMLNGIRTDLIEGRQEDAEEFLGCLLNNLNDEMLELIKLVKNDISNDENVSAKQIYHEIEDKEWQVMGPKNKGSVTRKTEFDRTPISDIFGGFLKSRIHRTGDLITENIQPFFTLQLNIEKVKTVKEALEALTTKYQLEGLTSSKTNEEVEAWQQVMLDELPIILVLHLKCFDFKLDGCTKIIKALEFPIDLKIDSKLLSSKTNTPKEKQYKLFAVVYHDGKEASKGHYVTDAFHVGYSSWLRYDDASVKPVQEEHVLKPQGTRVPYLLFYRRSDTIRSK